MSRKIVFLGLSLFWGILACKKEAEFPQELSAKDFYVNFSLLDSLGIPLHYSYQGEQRYSPDNATEDLRYDYSSSNGEANGLNYITSSIISADSQVVFSLSFQDQDPAVPVTSTSKWSKEKLEAFFKPGKRILFGDGPEQARMLFKDFPGMQFVLVSTEQSNASGELIVESVEDYGSPDIGIPYIAKRVRFRFNGVFFFYDNTGSGLDQTGYVLKDGEAALFFPYL